MSGADKNDCASWCVLPADHDGVCKPLDESIIPGVELTQWRAGRVLSQMDVAILSRYLDMVEEEESRTVNLFHEARLQIMQEIGGDELVKALEDDSEERCAAAVQNAIQRYYTRRSQLADQRKAEAN